ncbi:MAG: prepilin-type N-terminal cleavage/methylation domain-containing protein [Planctomycetaceae bacterium]|nr:prepilin-type N-terminal cleavage/methylation domain-containing protein [Planctomycetaceae bacterium]
MIYFRRNRPNATFRCFDSQNSLRQAFTLLELLIVLSIIVVIAALGTPGLMRMSARSRIDSAARKLQSELNLTRLEAMKSGEPLVFRFRYGVGNYEILSKQEYDRLIPKQQPPNSGLNGEAAGIAGINAFSDEAIYGDASGNVPLNAEQDDVVGSVSPSFGDYGVTSLADTLANSPPVSFADYATPSSLGDLGDAPTSGDLGDAPTVADRLAQPSEMQQIASLPTSKFASKQKELPDDLIFTDVAFQPERQQNAPIDVTPNGLQQNLIPNASPQNMPLQSAFQQNRWSEPIFFFPNGRTSNSHFAICTTGRYRYFIEISLRGLTGTARIKNKENMP